MKCRFSLSSKNSMDLCGRWLMVPLFVTWSGWSPVFLQADPPGDWGTRNSTFSRPWRDEWLRLRRLRAFLLVPSLLSVTLSPTTRMSASRSVSKSPTGRSIGCPPTWRWWWLWWWWCCCCCCCIARAFAISMSAGLPKSVIARRREPASVNVVVLGLDAHARAPWQGGRGGLLHTGDLPFEILEIHIILSIIKLPLIIFILNIFFICFTDPI